ncbi:WRC domain-containing protein/QLQ domain-containing protein [Cephalotus follicularis]|uniref:Growth-regulating factor n=1 Tax=Cephalotus follicularis TaxID=3775 RepID=A0A1Q3CR14_CEPFO|nr:WRC domain-containing protein/QLQ domain-containing protein [Cephalotus follicularis]
MLSASSSSSARNSRSPFTPTQWQELEHQALIFKYMVSGVPIPPELIYTVKRSLDSSLPPTLLPHQPIGWGCFQVGFGRKADPEPGRCRRTDGKKWRCSKEAYPDSKYCERHMHRGRNRSRKPVELTSTTPPPPPTTTLTSSSPSLSPTNLSPYNRNLSINNTTTPTTSCYPIAPEIYTHHNPFLYRPPGSGLPFQNDITAHHHFLESSGSYSQPDKDYRYVDERAFFPETSGNARSLHDTFQPLNTLSSYKGYSQSQYQGYTDNQKQQQQENHCFVLGTDIKSAARSIKLEKEDEETQKQLHHFFGEWPPKNPDSWLDLASNARVHSDS